MLRLHERCDYMIKSMTGFGRGLEHINGRDILVEIRSVNHRYYEFNAKVPRIYGYLEQKLKTFLNGKISRGKVEILLSMFNSESTQENIEVNIPIANGYINALKKANDELLLNDDLSLSKIIRLPDIFTVKKVIEDEEQVWNDVMPVVTLALEKFVSMREAEGEKMKVDFKNRLMFIEDKVGEIEKRSPEVTESYRKHLYDRLIDVLEDKNIDEQRILTEAAIFSEKTAVDEETVRLRSHISQFRGLIETDEPVGRKLDFLIQEFNREVNTIGSKAQNIDITKIVVDLKSEIEKIREQVQNIE